MKLSQAHTDQFHRQGFTLVEDFLDTPSLEAAQLALWEVFPRPETYFANPEAFPIFGRNQFAGLELFPYPNWSLNRLAVYPDLIDAAQRTCGTKDLDLYKVELWAKYAGAIDYEQQHHYDFGNHSLVVPKRASRFTQMNCFILLSDVTEADAPTRIVPKPVSYATPYLPRVLEAGAFEHEKIALTGPAGSLIAYQTDVLHRATDFTASERSRFIMLVDFQPRGWQWTGKMAWPNQALSEHWVESMTRMTPYERTLFGFPPPDDDYWDDQTIQDVAMRYPAMDMSIYVDAVQRTPQNE